MARMPKGMRQRAVRPQFGRIGLAAVAEQATAAALAAGLAVRTAIQTTAQAAARLRRDGWLGDDTQQRLL